MGLVVSTQPLMGNNQHHQAEVLVFLHIPFKSSHRYKENIPLTLSDFQFLHLTLYFRIVYSVDLRFFFLAHLSLLYRGHITVFAVIPDILLSISYTALLYPVSLRLGSTLHSALCMTQ